VRRFASAVKRSLQELNTVRGHVMTVAPGLRGEIIGHRVLPLAGVPISRYHGALTVAAVAVILRRIGGRYAESFHRFASILDTLGKTTTVAQVMTWLIKLGLGATVAPLYTALIAPVSLAVSWTYGPRFVVNTIAQGWNDYVLRMGRWVICKLSFGWIGELHVCQYSFGMALLIKNVIGGSSR
jgi:hypothetical protein